VTRFNLRLLELRGEEELRREMVKVGPDPRGLKIMLPKGLFCLVRVEGLGYAAASILKQEMLAKGGEAVLPSGLYLGREEGNDVLVMGTLRELREVIAALEAQPLPSLNLLAEELQGALAAYQGRDRGMLEIAGRRFLWGERTYIMGVINVTPDSFSGDGLGYDVEAGLAQARRFAQEGADILDVGGESTRPGSQPVSVEEELKRVLPVIEGLAGEMDVPISIDTCKAPVARRALEAGAHMVNDVWALRADPQLAEVVAERQVPLVLMHNRSRPEAVAQEAGLGARYRGIKYQDLMADIARELRESVQVALEKRIERRNIIIDPGIGFGKTVQQNLEVLRRLGELRSLGFPLLVGTSRKSFIGYTLNLPMEERMEGTAATVALAVANGADIVRVHDVRQMARVARMADAVVRFGAQAGTEE